MKAIRKIFLGTVILVFISICFVGAMLLAVPLVKSSSKSYFSGDAFAYQGQLVFATTNQGRLEIFKLSGSKIVRTAVVSNQNAGGSFSDPVLTIENNDLITYLVDGSYLYKYKISDLANPVLSGQIADYSLSNGWFSGLIRADDRVVTVGTNGLKLWNPALIELDLYRLPVTNPYNVILSPQGAFIFNLQTSVFTLYNAPNRNLYASFDSFDKYSISQSRLRLDDEHNRKAYNDDTESKIYIVDDRELKQLDFTSANTKSFRHTSRLGYDVTGIPGEPDVYFSDGIGVVKIEKATFRPVSWVYTTSRYGENGWAMGLKAVATADGDRLVVFNNSAILVLDSNLRLIDSYAFGADAEIPAPEALSLHLDRNRASANSLVSLSGTGFGASETVDITLAGSSWTALTDGSGRFTQLLTIPNVSKRLTDIKVVGRVSHLTYSISFQIE